MVPATRMPPHGDLVPLLGVHNTVTDSIEVGVTAIVCGVKGTNSPVAVGITGPTWRMKEAGLRRLSVIVEATASETGADLMANY
jgi:hypothetical protein